MLEFGKLILRHVLQHALRSTLTVAGMTVALFAFTMIHTMIESWHAGVEASAKNRLITRNAVSLVFYLPISYRDTISKVPGVRKVAHANWFGGVYRDERYRFAQFAVDENYLDIYADYIVSPEERKSFSQDRKGALIGEDLAQKYGFKTGDVIQLQGSIFPGLWEFTVRGVFHPRDANTVTRTMLFHWPYLNERNKAEILRAPDHAGFFAIEIENGADPAVVSKAVDDRFANSFAETLTETETAFQQSFVSMSSSIILALRAISLVVIVIMLLVLANTMLMSARERGREYAILKSMGFRARLLGLLIYGEALLLTLSGFCLLAVILIVIFSLPPRVLLGELINFFPVFRLNSLTVVLAFLAAVIVGCLAALAPARDVARLRVAEGLRRLA